MHFGFVIEIVSQFRSSSINDSFLRKFGDFPHGVTNAPDLTSALLHLTPEWPRRVLCWSCRTNNGICAWKHSI